MQALLLSYSLFMFFFIRVLTRFSILYFSFTLTALCRFVWCKSKWCCLINCKGHWLHKNSLPVLCVYVTWSFNTWGCLITLLQCWQGWSSDPCIFRIWRFTVYDFSVFPHSVHSVVFSDPRWASLLWIAQLRAGFFALHCLPQISQVYGCGKIFLILLFLLVYFASRICRLATPRDSSFEKLWTSSEWRMNSSLPMHVWSPSLYEHFYANFREGCYCNEVCIGLDSARIGGINGRMLITLS